MKFLFSLAIMAGILAGAVTPALADKEAEGKIKARQGYYQLVLSNAGPLFGMAKGDIDYDAALATKSATNLKLLSTMDNGALWAPGTSKEEMPGKTRALKEIWDTWPAVGEKIGAYNKAVDGLVANAGTSLEALRASVGPLGAACKACHDKFRADKF